MNKTSSTIKTLEIAVIGFLLLTSILLAYNLYILLSNPTTPAYFLNASTVEKPKVSAQDRKALPIPAGAVSRGKVVTVPILMYHHIGTAPTGSDAIQVGLTVILKAFSSKWRGLSSKGTNPLL